jgi:hypothetical protein
MRPKPGRLFGNATGLGGAVFAIGKIGNCQVQRSMHSWTMRPAREPSLTHRLPLASHLLLLVATAAMAAVGKEKAGGDRERSQELTGGLSHGWEF